MTRYLACLESKPLFSALVEDVYTITMKVPFVTLNVVKELID